MQQRHAAYIIVELSGSLKGNNVLLDWSTSLEINSKEFQIEKSNDGITYRKLYAMPAAGNSTIVKDIITWILKLLK